MRAELDKLAVRKAEQSGTKHRAGGKEERPQARWAVASFKLYQCDV